MHPYCPGFRLSQLKPIKDIHKNRGPALFASCANTGKLFFLWFVDFLIFIWKENNGNAIPGCRQVASAHEGHILHRDAGYVQLGRRRRSRKTGEPMPTAQHTMYWAVPSLQSRLRKMRHLFYLWSFSAADAKCVWISGEHFHLSLRGAGSSLTESARTNFLELSFLLVCETEAVKVTGIIHLLNTALLAGERLLSNSFMCLSAPVHQGKFATGRGFPGAGMGIKCRTGNSHVPEQVFSALHHDDAIEGGMFAHGPTESVSSYHKLNKE